MKNLVELIEKPVFSLKDFCIIGKVTGCLVDHDFKHIAYFLCIDEEAEFLLPFQNIVAEKDVLVVEDIIDSGRTLSHLMELLESRRPESLALCTLLDKPERRVIEVDVDYIGFEIPDLFVVGYGLDYAQKYRNLPYIGKVCFDNIS